MISDVFITPCERSAVAHGTEQFLKNATVCISSGNNIAE